MTYHVFGGMLNLARLQLQPRRVFWVEVEECVQPVSHSTSMSSA